MRAMRIVTVAGLLALGVTSATAQYFGKNKVQYTNFKWQYLQSEHFNIYFTEGGQRIAEFAAEVAEQSYQSLKKDFRYELTDRITIIVHNSHNDFGQTNVDLSPPEESVGGFTEFFKNRAVVPYDGEWERLRHVVHHELTHAVMLQMVYGSGVQSIITGLTRLQLPLWLVEGLAEYQSRGWDFESDMYMRDAAINGYLPEIEMLGGFLAYKGGQSVLLFISDRYGGQKIGELLGKIKVNKSVDRGLKQAIGVTVKDLSKRWQKWVKELYWPDIGSHREPEDIAKRLTDHKKDRNFVNTSPALSPKGDKIAFLSDRSDYFDVYLMSAVDGQILAKLVSGQKTANLEELHWLKGPNISWSPDGEQIVFGSKAGEGDVLHILDVKQRKIVRTLRFALDGAFNPSWSPDGGRIAFTGTYHGQSDIYAVELRTGDLRKLTDDRFSDVEPSWSPDGTKIVFASDRGPYVDPALADDVKIHEIAYKNFDIYELSVVDRAITRLTATDFVERTPVYAPDGRYVAFSSDRTGITNLYLKELSTGEEWAITDVLTGAFQPTWSGDGTRLAFTSFYNGGYDLYLLSNPLEIKPHTVTPAPTALFTKVMEQQQKDREKRESERTRVVDLRLGPQEKDKRYRNFVFDEKFADGQIDFEPEQKKVALDSAEIRTETGAFRVHDYEVKFSPDIIYGTAEYSQFFGVQGTAQLALSDVLGNHRINIYTNLFYDFRNSDYMVTYFYLPHRWDFGVGGYHNAFFFLSYNWGVIRDRNYGLSAYLSLPLSRYRRLDFSAGFMGIDRDYLDFTEEEQKFLEENDYLPNTRRRFLLLEASWVNDTSLWGITGPVNGRRSAVGLMGSPGLFDAHGAEFLTARLDWRRYYKVGKEYNFVVRVAGGISFGKQPQQFFVGGVENWINREFSGGYVRVNNIEDIYFASFEMPFRGGSYYELAGNWFLLTNIEFRFPLIRYFLMGWPLPIGFQDIRGALFADLAGAQYRGEHFRAFVRAPNGFYKLQDLRMAFGFGMRANIGFLVLQFDIGWPTDLYATAHSPRYYWSLGAEF